MLYRKLEPNVDTIQEGDYYVEYRRLKPFSRIASMIGEKVPESESEYFRPVPGPRSPEELTNKELEPFTRYGDRGKVTPQSIRRLMKALDELRARPRETEKEKWIREYCIRVANADSYPPYDGDIRGALSDTWDAATEAAREGK